MSFIPPNMPASGSSDSYDAAEKNMEDAVNQLVYDRNQMGMNLADLLDALEKMKKEIDAGHSDIALMMAFTTIFPKIFEYKQDNMTQLADSENVASGLRSFVNNASTAFNKQGAVDPSNPHADPAKDLYANVTALSKWADYLSTVSTSNITAPWTASTLPLAPTDAQNIEAACDSIKGSFTTGSWGMTTANSMDSQMQDWYKTPDGTTPDNPAPEIKAIQGALQTSNSSVSTLATTTQTQMQFYTNEYNQITGITNSLQQSQATQTGTLVRNQKAG